MQTQHFVTVVIAVLKLTKSHFVCGGTAAASLTAVQTWQPCPLWEPSQPTNP